MSPDEPEQRTEGFAHIGMQKNRGRHAPTLQTHGRARIISVPADWVSVVVFNFPETSEEKLAREEKERALGEKRVKKKVKEARRSERTNRHP